MKTLKMIAAGLIVAAAVYVAGCTLIGASIETSGYGFTVKGEVGGFTTETGFDLDKLLPEKEDE